MCLTMPTIADLIPTEIFPRGSINIPANLRLADPEFHLPRPVDLLIGAGVTVSLFSIGQIHLPLERGDLYLQKTRLGWIVVGDPLAQRQPASITCHFTKLEGQLERFWAIEEVNADVPRSREDSECETHFVENVHREDSGRYVVRLPFRNRGERLGESRSVALKRLVSLERRLNADAMLRVEYDRVIKEYLELGHMSLAESVLAHSLISMRTLGIVWNTHRNEIHYSVRSINVSEKLTKRKLLLDIAKIFDPLRRFIARRGMPAHIYSDNDNAPSHTSAVAMAKLHEVGFELIPYLSYSPDLAPRDFFLFPYLNIWLGGKKFSSNEEVIVAVNEYFAGIATAYFSDGIKKLTTRWTKCIALDGDYVEK
ncbi:Histone-lysine N-methyltransferase SETMAR [Ooceraea biroi]|uniref:Histone-lysine N-methyltransferase SETMAR n=1 Tax=Ooceraea biroi TaxID=2015173 RepID=A0A026W286_OOCBI|nr:Histone-lysine N-methyltransferase SETMAR [Ooceraea biroi]